ncbi:MAG: T9SS type A sorting domain-containing protein [Cryomorphaceae bacterium]|nr:T9SS type A sorting domain-containing protein [Cryomorphaceae bacterium]
MKPKLFYFIVFLILTPFIHAQTQFQRVVGTNLNDRNYHLAATSDGGMLGTGYTQSVPNRANEAFLVKFSRFGEVEWAKTYGDVENETTWDVIVAQNNDIITAGNTQSLSVNEAATLTRMDSLGNVIWSKAFHYPGGQVSFYRVIETSAGDLVAAGLARIDGSAAIIMSRLDAQGVMQWHKVVKTSGNDEIMGITETSQGDFLFAGLSNDPQGQGAGEFALVKTNPQGDVIWKKRYGSSGNERLNSVIEHNNSYYAMGFGTVDAHGSHDLVVIKTDTAGNMQWAKAYGTPVAERFFNIMYSPQNDAIMLTGYTDYSDPGPNNRNTVLVQIDTNGVMQWAKSYGSTGMDGHWPTGIATNDDEGFYLFASTTTMGPGDHGLYLIKTDLEGNTACNQKNPNFGEQTLTNQVSGNFGTDTLLTLTSVNTNFTGATWNISATDECCQLYIDAGADTFLCHTDTVYLGSPAIPGYQYDWIYNGTPHSNDAMIPVVWGDAGDYTLVVSAPVGWCSADTQSVFITEDSVPRPNISELNDSIYTDPSNLPIQWYLNGQPLSGANQTFVIPTQGGHYQVGLQTPAGCLALSNPLFYSGIGVNDYSLSQFVIYPNPGSGLFTLDFETTIMDGYLVVYDLSGRQLCREEIKVANTLQFDGTHLASGIYLFKVVSDGKQTTKRVVVQ